MFAYTLEFHLPYTEKRIMMTVQASDYDCAEIIGESIAEGMPSEVVYFDKNDSDIEVSWSYIVHEVEVK